MKVVLRADASFEIGTGHVMRQIAIAEELMREGAEVVLVGEVEGPQWLKQRLTTIHGLHYRYCPAGEFDPKFLHEVGATACCLDSYALTQGNLDQWQSKASPTIVFVDGPWQSLHGKIAAVPSLTDQSPWLTQVRKKFETVLAGPDFLMIRDEIRHAKQKRINQRPSIPQILIALGGSDVRGHTKLVKSVLAEFASEIRIVTIQGDDGVNFYGPRPDGHVGLVDAYRSSYVEELTKSTLVVSGAGVTSGELLFLGIPSIFIPVVENQAENARILERLIPSAVLRLEATDFESNLRRAVARFLSGLDAPSSLPSKTPTIDGLGARRLAKLLVGDVTSR